MLFRLYVLLPQLIYVLNPLQIPVGIHGANPAYNSGWLKTGNSTTGKGLSAFWALADLHLNKYFMKQFDMSTRKFETISLPETDWVALQERLLKKEDGRYPSNWPLMLNQLSIDLFGNPASRFTLRDLITRDSLLVCSLPSREVLCAALANSHYIYLCWGLRLSTLARRLVARFILMQAQTIFVNDIPASEDVKRLSHRSSTLIPYIVDTNFFSPDISVGTEQFLFCPGSNDRDPDVLVGLAKLGYAVTWLCNDALLRKQYQYSHKNLKLVYEITFEELRQLYRTCRTVISPLRADLHAAGQTTTLEALACGKQVLLSEGRTATIFPGYESVGIINSADPSRWHYELTRLANVLSTTVDERLAVGSRYGQVLKALQDVVKGFK